MYATVLVIIVATLLSLTFSALKPMQDNNVKVEKYQNILASIGIESTTANAEDLYKEYIQHSYVFNAQGELIQGEEAFDIRLKDEFKKKRQGKADEMVFPVFEAIKDNKSVFIFPLRGNGLWGPIWGFVSLKADLNEVYGAIFDHQGETPGLGAEITTTNFESRFAGKKLFNESQEFMSVEVVKPGTKSGDHAVDGLSGATITCQGVNAMVKDNFSAYKNFILNARSQEAAPAATEEAETEAQN